MISFYRIKQKLQPKNLTQEEMAMSQNNENYEMKFFCNIEFKARSANSDR